VHNIWGRSFRKRSAENVLSEIKYLMDTFGIKEIHFEDDNLTLDRKRAIKIFNAIKERKLKLQWATPNGVSVNTVDEELLNLMKESGCYSISFGIESGDKYVLANIIKKRLDLDKATRILKHSRNLGLETSAFFVVGLPGEEIDQLKNTFKFARSIAADSVNFSFATALPGTELWQQAKQKNLLPEGYDYLDFRAERPSLKPNGFSRERLRDMVAKEKFVSYISLLFSNPTRFFKKALFRLNRGR